MDITYKKGLIAYIDIVGFKEILRQDSDKAGNYLVNIEDQLKGIENQKGNDHNIKIKSIAINDCIVLISKDKDDNREKIHSLKHFCAFIARVQYRWAKKGVWIRGGVAHGEFYFKKPHVVGDAFFKAYDLEKIAKYPRVILDSESIVKYLEVETPKEVIKNVNDYNLYPTNKRQGSLFDWESAKIRNSEQINMGLFYQDIPLFIDYFLEMKGSNFESTRLVDKEVEEIKSQIKKGLKGKVEHYKKYQWLREYFSVINKKHSSSQEEEKARDSW